jgi:hypothetical protein
MTFSTRTGIALFAAALMAASSPAAFAQDMPPMPKPGPEHEVLKTEAGTWDATIEMETPGGPMTSKGVETNRMGCGGLCLISDFTGEFMPGIAFEGHGVTVYDAAKKKYVGSWTDSMSSSISMGESTYDAATKTSTGVMEGTDMTGAQVKMKTVVEHRDPDTRVFTMFNPDGAPGMKITYKRKK